MLDEGQQATLWGDLFEVAVKRGCLGYLLHRHRLPGSGATWQRWQDLTVGDLHQHLASQSGVVDPAYRRRQASSLDHLLLVGWGLGWTTLRGYLRRLEPEPVELRALFCPLSLPDRRTEATPPEHEERIDALWRELGLGGAPDPRWLERGQPANADFLLLARTPERHHLLCLEFSLYAQLGDADFGSEAAHLEELTRYLQRVEARGVFTRLAAEVTGEHFGLSERLVSYLPALTTRDKPLYKLCQGSSYATRLIHLLGRRGQDLAPVSAQVIAVTSAGLEGLSARFDGHAEDPRARLMDALGAAYRARGMERNEDPAVLIREIVAVQSQVARSLPPALRTALDASLAAPPSDRRLDVRHQEVVTGYSNPADAVPRAELLRWLADAPPEVDALLGSQGRAAVVAELDRQAGDGPTRTLRDLHAAAMRAGLRAAPPGQLSVLAAEGHPGIGKTTAVLDYLGGLGPEEGYLFLYASPRIVINSDVSRKVARTAAEAPTGVLTLTTNARLIRAAPTWQARQDRQAGRPRRRVDAAVVVDGVPDLQVPASSTLFLAPELAQAIDDDYASRNLRKETWSERDDVVQSAPARGVLATLAGAARGCLAANPHLNRLVLTAAVQGFRDLSGARSTVDRLSGLFRYPADTPRGAQERTAFAHRLPTVVVMVDEIAGDGAGSPFVHALAAWLEREFLDPFAGEAGRSPFRVVLVLADASLANEQVLTSYLLHQAEAPEKVLVAASAGRRPFRLAAGRLRLGGRSRRALHVMADGFPASSVTLDYHLRLTPVVSPPRRDGPPVRPRLAILEQQGEDQLRQAVAEIFAALQTIPHQQQVIFFAQDKRFLRDVRQALLAPERVSKEEQPPFETGGVVLGDAEIGLLDSSVPEWRRRQLIDPRERDSKRVFLMTSSGARGVSFPLATTIIALVPTFAIESGFMEIAQLIYRGRGRTREVDGDRLDRRIVLVLQDHLVVADEPVDDRTWLRRKLDLISALVLLRAALLTRITGDAGIPRQQAAVVPVGRIGTEELETSLSTSVASVLREGHVFLGEAVPGSLRQLVQDAMDDTQALFRDFRWTIWPAQGQHTLASGRRLETLRGQVCAPAAPLLPAAAVLPEETSCLGPVWLERWAEVPAQEAFRFDALVEAHAERKHRLVKACWRIAATRELPGPLRRAARDVGGILARPDDLQALDFSVRTTAASRQAWGCLPVDHTRLCRAVDGDDEDGPRRIQEPEAWLEALGRCAAAAVAPTALLPVLPAFKSYPFAVLIARGDATGLARVFDDRYFMASTELNLLNTVLFVADQPPVDAV